MGAGYTSLWILQALADNESELRMCEASVCADGYNVAGAEWMVGDGESGEGESNGDGDAGNGDGEGGEGDGDDGVGDGGAGDGDNALRHIQTVGNSDAT